MGLMRTLDPGTMGGDEGSWVFLFLMFLATMGGIFVVGTLIGVLTTGLDAKMTELRKGRSIVAEKDHTVILGWSAQIFSIISELVIANQNRNHACIAILAEKDKVEMEDEIRDSIDNFKNTRIVCRTGNPIDPKDLEIVNIDESRSVIILSPEFDDADSQVIKTILAITNNPNRKKQRYHIVTTIHDQENLEIAEMVGQGEVQFILADELISRITAQTCRQSGLSVVYTELLDFSGDEIYFYHEPSLAGISFGEAQTKYEKSMLIGIRGESGNIKLNPPANTIIQKNDKIIAISEDDDTIRISNLTDLRISLNSIKENGANKLQPERTLIIGWNKRAPAIIKELDGYVAPGSELLVVADVDAEKMKKECSIFGETKQKIIFQRGETTNRRLLDRLAIHLYQHVIILSPSNIREPQKADAATLMTLLHLRDISEKFGNPFSIVSEMLDIRNRELAEVTKADDFIVSDKLISLLLSQISENIELITVFKDLFDPEGSEIYLKSAAEYINFDQPVNFYTVDESARRRREVAIGYRLQSEANDPTKAYGVYINPPKSQPIAFSHADKIITLSEE
jgi:voltage-gated potassium channel Kch